MSRSSSSRRRTPARRSQMALARGARGRGLDDLDGVGFEHPREQVGGGLRLAELRLAHTADRHISHPGERLHPRRRRDHGRTGRATRRRGGRGTAGLGERLGGGSGWPGTGRGSPGHGRGAGPLGPLDPGQRFIRDRTKRSSRDCRPCPRHRAAEPRPQLKC